MYSHSIQVYVCTVQRTVLCGVPWLVLETLKQSVFVPDSVAVNVLFNKTILKMQLC